MITDHLPVFIIVIPLLVAFALPLIDRLSALLRDILSVSVAVLNVIMCLVVGKQVQSAGSLIYVMGSQSTAVMMPSGNILPIRILLEVDGFGILIAFASSLVAIAVIVYSLCFMKKHERLGKYYALMFICIAAINGMLFTGDLFNLFVFLEVLSLASAGLVSFWREDDESPEAAFKYIVISTVASLFVLFAIGILYGQYGALNIAALAGMIEYGLLDKVALCMFVAGFAMKCGAAPLHMWLADLYSRTPASITALFVVISQISLYALVRVMFTLFGIKLNTVVLGWIVVAFGIISMIVGALMALPQKDIKRMMAYQGISQTGYMLLGIGTGLVVLSDPEALSAFGITAINGGIFHIVNDIIYKSLLFLAAGAVFYRLGTRNMDEMGGLAKKMPFTTIIFIIGMFAISGIPPFNGFASKFLIYESVFRLNPLLSVIAIIVSILTLAAFMKAFHSIFLGSAKTSLKNVKEVPNLMIISMLFLSVMIIIIGLFPGFIVNNFIQPATDALVSQAGYIGAILP
ncbi:MAG: proton-conducting transporter membrane subunit [Candidatus Woesearchaeota archaeon]